MAGPDDAQGEITIVSKAADGTLANYDSFFNDFSSDGTKVLFTSDATNLMPGVVTRTQPSQNDLYMKDLVTGTVTLINATADGKDGDASSTGGVFTPDGSSVIFASTADNLVPGDSNGAADIFMKNLATGAVTRLSTTSTGAQANGGSSGFQLSSNGNYLVFTSQATNLVPGTHASDVFLKNLATGAVTLVSAAANGAEANDVSGGGVFVGGDAKIAFVSSASNLVAGDTNGKQDLFIKDLFSGAVTRVSVAADGTQSDGDVKSYAFSADGTKVAFWSTADNLVPGDTNGIADLFLKDLTTGAITRVTTAYDGSEIGSAHVNPTQLENYPLAFSPDGTQLAFASGADDLVPGDTNVGADIFIKNLVTGEITRISTAGDGSQGSFTNPLDNYAYFGGFSPDGSAIIFSSEASLTSDNKAPSQDSLYLKILHPAPATAADFYSASYGAPLVVDAAHGVLANDAKVDRAGTNLVATLKSGPAHGTISLNADGSFTYTPDGTFIGVDTFSYDANSGWKDSPDTAVSITVNGNITRVSVDSHNQQVPLGGEDPDTPQLSPDGHYVLFSSSADGLVSSGATGYDELYLKDLRTGEVRLVSVDQDGRPTPDATAIQGHFSADGTQIVYIDSTLGVVVKNLVTGAQTVVSTTSDGTPGNGVSGVPSFSPDGTKVTFFSFSNNLFPGDGNNTFDVFVKDLTTGALTLVSSDAGGHSGNGDSSWSAFSPDGNLVAFSSQASNLVAGDTNNFEDIFVKNLTTGAIQRISTTTDGAQANGNSDEATFSPDGKWVAFISAASNFPGAVRAFEQVYIKNLQTGQLELVSSTADGTPSTGVGTVGAAFPVFSPDGSRIAFFSTAQNLVPGFDNLYGAVFEKNLITGNVRLVSTNSFEEAANGWSTRPSYSADGTLIAFFSRGSNLVPGDTNSHGDVFVKDLTEAPLGSPLAGIVPTAHDDSYAVTENTSLTVGGGVLANDSDAQNRTLQAVLHAGPTHGSLLLQADGSFSYTPDAGFTGSDSFTYWASNGIETSGLAKVSFSVAAPTGPVWIGGGSDAWSDPANWADGKVPGPDDDVVITGPVTLDGDAGTVHGLTIQAAGSLTVAGAGALTLADGLRNDGALTIDGGSFTATGALTGSGSITLLNHAQVALDGAVAAGETISVIDGKLVLADPSDFAGTIAGLDAADQLDLSTRSFNAGDKVVLLSGNVLQIESATGETMRLFLAAASSGAGQLQLQLDPNDDFNGLFFHLADDGSGGTMVTVDTIACYVRGTLIMTERGAVPVERLTIGDLLITASGAARPIRWIGRRSYSGRFVMGRKDILPICFKAGSLGAGTPNRDLWISPHHAMYFRDELGGGVLIEARDLVDGLSIIQAEHVDEVEYFHIELETHDIIIAEGALSESFVDDDSRGMFHNAHDYRALYPDAVAAPARYCAPRLADGDRVEAVRRHIARRAGRRAADDQVGTRGLRGYLDHVDADCIAGWAQNPDFPEAPVCLDIYAAGRPIGQVLANAYRHDLREMGLGSGCHGFVFRLPSGLSITPGSIEVRRSIDGAVLTSLLATPRGQPAVRCA